MLAPLWIATGSALEQRCRLQSRASWPAARVCSCEGQLMHAGLLRSPPLAVLTLLCTRVCDSLRFDKQELRALAGSHANVQPLQQSRQGTGQA